MAWQRDGQGDVSGSRPQSIKVASVRIVPVKDSPELANLVARWRVNAFFPEPGGYTVQEMTGLILRPPDGPNATLVLFEGEEPVGTAGVMQGDLACRPDLGPWLGGLYVEPAFRRRGHAVTLVRAVEEVARRATVAVLWLYTHGAEDLYLRLGWRHAGTEQEDGRQVTLMRRDLGRQSPPP